MKQEALPAELERSAERTYGALDEKTPPVKSCPAALRKPNEEHRVVLIQSSLPVRWQMKSIVSDADGMGGVLQAILAVARMDWPDRFA